MVAKRVVIYAIILNFNGTLDTLSALESLQSIRSLTIRSIVIDNGSERDETETIRQSFPRAQVIRLEQNVGFARGVNHAARVALLDGATHLLLMNSDSTAKNADSVLASLLWHMSSDRRVAAAGPMIIDGAEGDIVQSVGYRYSLWWPLPRANLNPKNINYCIFASGSFLLLDAVRFATLQGLDPDFFLYGEDLDYALRLRRAGFRIVIDPSISIHHRRGASSKIMSNAYVYTALRGNLINIRKHARWYQLPTATLTSIVISIALIARAAERGNALAWRAVYMAWSDFARGRWGGLYKGHVLTTAVRPGLSDIRSGAA